MNRIDQRLACARAAHRGAVMPFVCGAHPAPGLTARLLPAISRAGADVIEVGIPFSDPVADGPVIAAAMHDAIALGATPATVLDEIAAARAATDAGVVAMVSISIVQRAGDERFVRDCARAGVDGLIIPDLPFEESERLRSLARAADLTMSLLIAPTTPPERAAAIARACTGFVYLLARAGITGESQALDTANLQARVAAIRSATTLPLACGFGISTPDHVRQVLAHADAAIVGSALVRRISQASLAHEDPVAAGAAFVADLARAAEPDKARG